MDSEQLQSMSTDQLWDLYEKIHSALADKLQAEKRAGPGNLHRTISGISA